MESLEEREQWRLDLEQLARNIDGKAGNACLALQIRRKREKFQISKNFEKVELCFLCMKLDC